MEILSTLCRQTKIDIAKDFGFCQSALGTNAALSIIEVGEMRDGVQVPEHVAASRRKIGRLLEQETHGNFSKDKNSKG